MVQQFAGPRVSQIPSGTLVQQAPAPYAAYQEEGALGGITEMITAIMPLIMIVMLMKMVTPMLEGVGGGK